jgi:hypothetical protein
MLADPHMRRQFQQELGVEDSTSKKLDRLALQKLIRSKAEAEKILAALQKGESFSRLARKRSLGIHAAKGGDRGWVNFQALPPPLQKAVAMLKAGDVGGPLQKSDDEFLLVGLEGRRPVRAKSLAEARPEIERRLLPAKQREVIQAWLSEQEKKSRIEVFFHPDSSELGEDEDQSLGKERTTPTQQMAARSWIREDLPH